MRRNGPFQKPGPGPAKISAQAAEALAIEVLSFFASDPERLERFMSLSGLGVENLRVAAAGPGFLAAVLDHLSSDEALLLAFAANSGRDPGAVAKARASLSPPPPQ
jgi:hypothetical protein